MSSIQVLIADDHAIIRGGLRVLLERQPGIEVVGEGADGREAVDLALSLTPDIVMLDISMPRLNGIEAARRICSELPKTQVIILSVHSDESYVLKALKAGARGYLLKDALEPDIVQAVRVVHQGKSFLSPEISRLLVEDYVRQMQHRQIDDSYELLTSREREILQLLAEGKSNRDIANLLQVSVYTVETHRSHILQKLNLHSLADLILYAVRKGVIS
jgi:two-component system response regulator NreC